MDGWLGHFRSGDGFRHFKRLNQFADNPIQFMAMLGAEHFSKTILWSSCEAQGNTSHPHTCGFTSLPSHLNPSVKGIIQVTVGSRLWYIVSVHKSKCSVSLAENVNQDKLWITLTCSSWIILKDQSLPLTAYVHLNVFLECTFLTLSFNKRHTCSTEFDSHGSILVTLSFIVENIEV